MESLRAKGLGIKSQTLDSKQEDWPSFYGASHALQSANPSVSLKQFLK